ncbi:L-serine ammonia-lyase, iron-sulfur-dependent subunit beta [Citroniella saccharovorans]|uniref:L-serine deaminase n=1 Tax=Citroniella saccharovorans TaxID=2053367 RepID=A0AAW9MRJ6_9FIRM|nr:L-serine ammonia-lyase, iron-sulfur-dependent subunit beta [Citroniella saccharovorans]MEB3429696.1 L-serine ammonia-lyase, iron-sulfur-dependent subunit beta [Citroniella saccharovorans]
MKKYDIFEIMGPTMIGPSSSHTAGAARIGMMARNIYGKEFNNVTFYLHGSFQTTYQGHGSDRALVGGVMGMMPDDERLVDSLNIAKEIGLDVKFKMIDLGFVHPNTIKVVFNDDDVLNRFYITASSIGGGKIEVLDVNGIQIKFTGEYPTIVAEYMDRFGMIADISQILTRNNISIASLKVSRNEDIAQMVMELDQPFNDDVITSISSFSEIIRLVGIKPM